jgi:hypothetical protein
MSNSAILADCKTQNASLFHAMFRHDCPLTVKLASRQWNLLNKKKKTWRDSAPIDMFLSAVSVLVVVQPSSEVPDSYDLKNSKICMHFALKMAKYDLKYDIITHKKINI